MNSQTYSMKELFRAFKSICENEHFVYSLEQAAEMIETDLDALKKWSFSEFRWPRQVDMHRCRYYCALNIGRACGKGELTEEEAKMHLLNLGYGRTWDMFETKSRTVFGELKRRAHLKDAEKLKRREQFLNDTENEENETGVEQETEAE